MIQNIPTAFGCEFEEAYECTSPKVDRIMNAFGTPHEASVIYSNDQVDIFRYVIQTQTGRICGFKIMYAAVLNSSRTPAEQGCDQPAHNGQRCRSLPEAATAPVRIDTDRYIITCGEITTANLKKVPEYEKTGKRKLYNAIKRLWKVRF